MLRIGIKYTLGLLAIVSGQFIATAQTANTLVIAGKYTDNSFPLFTASAVASICIDNRDAKVVAIAATAFANDIKLLSGKEMQVLNNTPPGSYNIIAGTIGSSTLIDGLVKDRLVDVTSIRNKWERFIITLATQQGKKVLVIAGSDRRGTAYGIFHLSRTMGVSPFVWWADVTPVKRKELYVSGSYISTEPSVKYRGIFINDEDWGLQPWAAKNMDTDIKDIGAKTYAKVFELLLRLKANYIWPAMHPSTKAFYYYKDNPKIADDYAIVVGSSHAEPMLRNNVFEWAVNFENEYGRKHGEWRYDSNRNEIHTYWNDRAKQAKNYESVFTVGMRGVHDSGMPGPKDPGEKLKLLEQIITDQRQILQDNLKRSPEKVPQVFVPYKEVLSLYRQGMKLPEDITIIWPDDNHGYIRQLPNEAERKRSGGHGVYYHLSYWGAPQDFLWLSSISPALISYEMTKAYKYGADRLWVFNIGDIKPAELELQFAMDLAWDVSKWPPEKAQGYTHEWAKEIFGEALAGEIAAIKDKYYLLAASAKPEHINAVNFSFEQSKQRRAEYYGLYHRANNLRDRIPDELSAAYFELIAYPVCGATLLNDKILSAKLSFHEYKVNAGERKFLSDESKNVFDQVKVLNDIYNNATAGGKWNGIMSWHPRDQPVFKMPPTADSTNLDKDSLEAAYFKTKDPQLVLQAATYSLKKEAPGTTITEIAGLGINGRGITVTHTGKPIVDISGDDVYIEFQLPGGLEPGEYTIEVKCLPVFDVNASKFLRYAISLDDEPSQLVNVHAETDSKQWRENVLRGYSSGTTIHRINSTSKNILRVYFKDINLVINTIEFYNLSNAITK